MRFIAEALKQTDRLYHDRQHFRGDIGFVRRSRARGAAPGRQACKARRSERREALVLVMKTFQYRMDLCSRRVGAQRLDGRCAGLTVEIIAAYCGLPVSRVERAIADLKDAGFVEAFQAVEKVGDRYIGLPAVYRITLLWFHRIGLAGSYDVEQRQASRRRRTAAAAARAALAPALGVVKAAGLWTVNDHVPKPGKVDKTDQDDNDGRRLVHILDQLRRENANREIPLTYDEIRAEAQRRLRGPPPTNT